MSRFVICGNLESVKQIVYDVESERKLYELRIEFGKVTSYEWVVNTDWRLP